MTNKTLIIEGNLSLSEMEAGFAPCAIDVARKSGHRTLDMIIAEATNTVFEPNTRGYALIDEMVELGHAKITIEFHELPE